MNSSNRWADLRTLPWLPEAKDWSAKLKSVGSSDHVSWGEYMALANTQIDFIQCDRLSRAMKAAYGNAPPKDIASKPVRLAVCGSSTVTHLLSGIRIGGVRRGMWIETYECGYGQYLQELNDTGSSLYEFLPDVVLFSLDSRTLARAATIGMDRASASAVVTNEMEQLKRCWLLAREKFKCSVIQQTALPIFNSIMGHNEDRLPGSRASIISSFNARLKEIAPSEGVDLLAMDDLVKVDGVSSWYDASLWHRAKQEITPRAGPLYGDHVARLLAAKQGRSYKCLVLDLDNTLWGGVIGDDGIEGIVVGQGSAVGEAFLSVQEYAKELAQRGIILAVCSKNDEANALAAFERHPEMLLRAEDIACFVANWDDKAKNIRAIATRLNIGLDSLVFLDDNPFERNLVRSELPMVAVPEIPDDPALFAAALSGAGYFEGLSVTDEDRERTKLYRGNIARDSLAEMSTDMPAYLQGLSMTLVWKRFDLVGQKRVVQLINKTNQFNLTTRRYSDDDFLAVLNDTQSFGLQLRLVDRFGDNGIIGIVIGRLLNNDDVLLDTWLMSCRVLGRQVEEATLHPIILQAQLLGAKRIIGEYQPTSKNKMVAEHYAKLGFQPCVAEESGCERYQLLIDDFRRSPTFIEIKQG